MTTTKPYIVGLSGKIHSGKSFVAKSMVLQHDFNIQSFAGPLKEDVVAMGFDRKVVYYKKPPWMRALLQVYGQAKRALDPDYWVKRAANAIDLCKPGSVFIFDDVRFPNEVEWIESRAHRLPHPE
jgi:hypothetical protein